MMAEVTLSIARPPYSSGMSTAIRPRSPAFASSARVTSKCLASISSAAGRTSLMRKVRGGFGDLPLLVGEVFRRKYIIGRTASVRGSFRP